MAKFFCWSALSDETKTRFQVPLVDSFVKRIDLEAGVVVVEVWGVPGSVVVLVRKVRPELLDMLAVEPVRPDGLAPMHRRREGTQPKPAACSHACTVSPISDRLRYRACVRERFRRSLIASQCIIGAWETV